MDGSKDYFEYIKRSLKFIEQLHGILQRKASLMVQDTFDHKLAQECARAFSVSTGLGCTVSDTAGHIFYEHGKGCGAVRCARRRGFPMRTVSAPITME